MPVPQAELLPFNSPNNVDIINTLRGQMTPDFQARIPVATKASMSRIIDEMWNYDPGRNAFVDSLINALGPTIIRYLSWTNPLAKFKGGPMNYGMVIEDVMVGIQQAYHYSEERDYLEGEIFGRQSNETQSRFYKQNRKDYYKVTVNDSILRQAFSSEQGLSQMVVALMASLQTSDQLDEFLLTTRMLRTMYDEGGLVSVNVPNIATNVNATTNDAQQFLKIARQYATLLQYPSRKYNPAKMYTYARPEKLHLILTPLGAATIDVEALAFMFNLEKAEIRQATTVIPDEYINIPNFQGLLTTEDLFVIRDNKMATTQANNPVGLYSNHFWHHWETFALCPFVPAVLLTTDPSTVFTVLNNPVVGISALTVQDNNGVAITGTPPVLTRGKVYEVLGNAITNPAGGVNNGLNFSLVPGKRSQRTKITQSGVLLIGYDETATTLSIVAQATDDTSFQAVLQVNLTGTAIDGGLAPTIDNDPTVLSNKTLPRITPNSGNLASATSLSADPGTWDPGAADSYTYQWNRVTNGTAAAISGATTDTYTVQSADVNNTLSVSVTAVKAGFTSVTVTSRPTQTITAS